jgi:hypothetical protein
MPKHRAGAISRMQFFILFLLILFGGIVAKEAPASQAESGTADIELKSTLTAKAGMNHHGIGWLLINYHEVFILLISRCC